MIIKVKKLKKVKEYLTYKIKAVKKKNVPFENK